MPNESALADPSVTVASFYMDNVGPDVVSSQRAVVEMFKPSDFAFRQTPTRLSHADAIDDFLKSSGEDVIVLLDVDCIPLSADALPTLVARAVEGALAGCVQRANHLRNDAHLYVAPFCMAFLRRLWEDIGRPSFQPTERGDVGEELTYRCEQLGRPTHMLWPSLVESPIWDLAHGRKFGPNTEYGDAFLHAFGIRDRPSQRRFVDICRAVGSERESDRHYWHRYTARYEQAFAALEVRDILEFGVGEGASMRSLARRFLSARIVGADIVPRSVLWPHGSRIEYVQVDQADRGAVAAMFERLGRLFDLIIDDGSHVPQHQAICLCEGFPFVRPGGLYILEDIHTSHPSFANSGRPSPPMRPNALNVLLAFQHYSDIGRQPADLLFDTLSSPSFFPTDKLRMLWPDIKTYDLYRRTSLPLRCYQCGSEDFDYIGLRCGCGADIYLATDSMSVILTRKE